MTTITTRAGKNSPLSNVEVDGNFNNLNTAKLELGQAQSSGTANGVLYLNASKQVASNGNFAIDSSGNLTQALGSSVATGGNLTVRSPDGVEGGQITLNNKANNAAAYNFDVDASDNGRLFTTQNNTSLSIGQLAGTGGSVAVYTGGLSRVHVASDGHVGIGTTPSVPSGFSRFVAIGDSDTGIGQISDGVLAVSTNNVERMRIDGAGKTKFTGGGVSGEVVRVSNSTADSYLIIDQADASATNMARPVISLRKQNVPSFQISADGAAAHLGVTYYEAFTATGQHVFYTNGTERMRIDSSGNVSIGTQTAAAKLDIGPVDNANEGAEVKLRGATNAVVDWNFDVYQNAFRLFTTDKGAGTNWQGRLSISHDTGSMVQVGSGTFIGHSIRNNAASATVIGHSYVDFQNELGVATGSIINVHDTDGSSRIDFSATPSGARNSDRRATVFQVYGNGNALAISPNGGLGYGTGSGGTASQPIQNAGNQAKNLSVTLHKPTGQITMGNAALAAGAMVRFQVNNSLVTASDNVIVTKGAGGSTQSYNVWVDWVTTGSFDVTVKNVSAGSLSEAVVINFAVIKGATA